MSNQIKKRTPKQARADLFGMLGSKTVREQVSAALGGRFDINQFTRMAMTAYSRGDEKLQEAHTVSIIGAVVQAAQSGLSLDPLLGEAFIVARWNRHMQCNWASVMVGYPGLMKRASRAEDGLTFDMQSVYEGDEFTYQMGTDPKVIHRRGEDPKLGDNGEPKVVAAYAVAHFPNGHKRIFVMMRWEIEKARLRSGRPNGGAWKSDYGAMAAKTALRRLTKTCPMDEKTTRIIRQEDQAEASVIQLPEGFEEMLGTGFQPPPDDDESEVSPDDGAVETEATELEPVPATKPKPPYSIEDLKAAAREKKAEEDAAAQAVPKSKSKGKA